ncbi:MAG: CYTH domain-containing protein [Acutalibacteraceae bacterium]
MQSPLPLEIERKYLIRYPDIKQMEQMKGYNKTEIAQTYIEYEKDGLPGRIRKRGINGEYKYTLTCKGDLTSVTRIEIEKEISEDEYESLLKTAKKGFNTVYKERHCFEYSGLLYEIDVYPFWSDRAIMEAEVQSEDTQIPVPPCISIIKEVTDDKRYRNSALARQIFSEPI